MNNYISDNFVEATIISTMTPGLAFQRHRHTFASFGFALPKSFAFDKALSFADRQNRHSLPRRYYGITVDRIFDGGCHGLKCIAR